MNDRTAALIARNQELLAIAAEARATARRAIERAEEAVRRSARITGQCGPSQPRLRCHIQPHHRPSKKAVTKITSALTTTVANVMCRWA